MSDIITEDLITDLNCFNYMNELENNIRILLDQIADHIHNIIKSMKEDNIINENIEKYDYFKLKLFGFNENPPTNLKLSKIIFHSNMRKALVPNLIKYIKYINIDKSKYSNIENNQFINYCIEYECDNQYEKLCNKYMEWEKVTQYKYSMDQLCSLIVDFYLNKYKGDIIFQNLYINKIKWGLMLSDKKKSDSKIFALNQEINSSCTLIADYIFNIILLTIKQNVIENELLNGKNKFGFCILPLFSFPNRLKLEINHNSNKISFFQNNKENSYYGIVNYKIHVSKHKNEFFGCDHFDHLVKLYKNLYDFINEYAYFNVFTVCDCILDKYLEIYGETYSHLKISKIVINYNTIGLRFSWLDYTMI